MNKIWVGLSVLGLGLLGMPMVAQAQVGLPGGYTRVRTPIQGQHCYRSGGTTYFYCYPRAISTYRTPASSSGSMMSPGGSMMQSSPRPSSSGSMMSPGGSMMQPSPRPSSSGSMMSPGGSMMQPNPSPNH